MLLEKSLLILLVGVLLMNNMKIINFGLFDISYSKILDLKSVYCVSFTVLIYGVRRNLNTIVFHNMISK